MNFRHLLGCDTAEQKALMSKPTELRDAIKESPPGRAISEESGRCPQSLCRTNSLDYYIGDCAEIDVHAIHKI